MKPASPIKFLTLSILLSSAGLPFASYAGPFCGDGEVNQASEECDEGDVGPSTLCNNTTDQFDGICQFTICGDNVVQTPNGEGFTEQCEPPGTATCDAICQTVTTTTTTTTTAAPTTTTTTAAPTTTTTTSTPTTTSTTGATTSTTGATTSTTGATTSTTGATTSTTGATTSTTGATTSTTGATTSTTGATTTTTQPGSGTVVIGGCDSGVQDPGGSISAMLAACDGSRNNGQYVSCVTKTTSKLKKAGVISGKEKGRIQRCAAQSE